MRNSKTNRRLRRIARPRNCGQRTAETVRLSALRNASARRDALDFPAAIKNPKRFRFELGAIGARMASSVLFLCTGNSARSMIAEAILNQKGRPNFRAFRADSHSTGPVNPHAIRLLESAKIPVASLRSKSWDEFTKRA